MTNQDNDYFDIIDSLFWLSLFANFTLNTNYFSKISEKLNTNLDLQNKSLYLQLTMFIYLVSLLGMNLLFKHKPDFCFTDKQEDNYYHQMHALGSIACTLAFWTVWQLLIKQSKLNTYLELPNDNKIQNTSNQIGKTNSMIRFSGKKSVTWMTPIDNIQPNPHDGSKSNISVNKPYRTLRLMHS